MIFVKKILVQGSQFTFTEKEIHANVKDLCQFYQYLNGKRIGVPPLVADIGFPVREQQAGIS